MSFHRGQSAARLVAVAGAAAAVITLAVVRRVGGSRVPPRIGVRRRRADGAGTETPGPGLAAVSPAAAVEAEGAADGDFVRPAGPEAMRDAPRQEWDLTDEASDESFPASDPPGNY